MLSGEWKFCSYINVRIHRRRIHASGVNTPCVIAIFRCKHQSVKTDFQRRSLKLGKFIAGVYDVYFPRNHGNYGNYGTDADHVPVIPGNNFALMAAMQTKLHSNIPRLATWIGANP